MSQKKYGGVGTKDSLWEKAKTVPGKDPAMYRQDPYGTVLYKPNYGKTTPMGYHVDHIKPTARGGSDNIRNLQLLSARTNLSKQDTLVKKSRHNQK